MLRATLCCLLAVGAFAMPIKTIVNATAPDDAPWGPDVSHYQGDIDWDKVHASGVSFAFAKATEGHTYVDAEFAKNWAGMKAAGIEVRGAYHFGRPGEDATTQAQHFLHNVGNLAPGEFVALDIEVTDSQSPATVAAWSKRFVDDVTKGLGVPVTRVLVYTGAWFWDPDAGGSSSLSDHPLWVSGYTTSPPMPRGWTSWTFWQYTDKQEVSGISGGVDCSRFYGTEAQLKALAGL